MGSSEGSAIGSLAGEVVAQENTSAHAQAISKTAAGRLVVPARSALARRVLLALGFGVHRIDFGRAA